MKGTGRGHHQRLSTTKVLIELGLKDKIAGMLNRTTTSWNKYKADIAAIPQVGDKRKLYHKKLCFILWSQTLFLDRNMMFSENLWGQLVAWNENKIPVYAQRGTLSNTKQDLGNIVEDVKNIGDHL